MKKLNRRQSLKILGITSAVAFVDPLKVIEEAARKSYNFVPGEYYRHALSINKPVKSWTEYERHEFISILDG